MINKHEGCSRGFSQWSELSSKKEEFDITEDVIMFGFYDLEGGGTTGEMAMRWHDLGDGEAPAARLEVFDDGWSALAQCSDVIAKMAEWDNRNPQPDDFVQLLLECGFKDITPKRHD